MPMTKKKSVCILNDDNDLDSDTVDNSATAEQQEHDEVLFQKTAEKKKRHVKQGMFADIEDVLTDWIRETPCLYQKGLREHTEKN